MKRILYFAILLFFICSCSKEETTSQDLTKKQSSDSTYQTMTVQNAGSLKLLLGNKINYIYSLTLKGSLNGTDIATLLSMENLCILNLADANIVAGGSISTINNVFPAIGGYRGSITSITLPNSVTSIGKGAFYCCTGLTSIIIPNSVTSIGDDAFFSCTGLTSIIIPNSVTSIGNGAFFGCSRLTEIHCLNKTPISIVISYYSYDLFDSVIKTTCKLYVPIGSSALYKAAAEWKDFTNIIEE